MSEPEELPRPGRRATPEEFYTRWAPDFWRALRGELSWPRWRFDLALEITDVAERYTVTFEEGVVSGRTGGCDNPLASFRFDRASWEIAARDVVPRVVKHLNQNRGQVHRDLLAFVNEGHRRLNLEDLRELPGTIELAFTDDAGDTARFEIRVGDGSGPKAAVEAGDADLWAFLESGGKLVNLVKSRLQIAGDAGYVIRLAHFFERASR